MSILQFSQMCLLFEINISKEIKEMIAKNLNEISIWFLSLQQMGSMWLNEVFSLCDCHNLTVFYAAQ